MAVVTNKSINSGSVTNKEFGSSDMTWAEADFEWGEASGTWENPYKLVNKAVNTASVTNKA